MGPVPRLLTRWRFGAQYLRVIAGTPEKVYRNRARIDLLEARVNRLEQILFASRVDDVLALQEALAPKPSGHRFMRFGSPRDGGYVLAVDFGLPDVVLSIGVGAECSADDDLARRGVKVWQFDHTVTQSPTQEANVHFVNFGLSRSPTEVTRPLRELMTRTDVQEHESVWLMLDAEGVEWDLLADTEADLSRFQQLCVEFHLLSWFVDDDRAATMIDGLRRIAASHVPVAFNINNFAPVHVIGGKRVPDVLEVTFVRRAEFVPGEHAPDPDLFARNNRFGPSGGEAFASVPLSTLGSLPEVLA